MKNRSSSFVFPLLMAVILALEGIVDLLGGHLPDSSDPYLSTIVFELLIFIIPAVFFSFLRHPNGNKLSFIKPFSPVKLSSALLATPLLIGGTLVVRLIDMKLTGRQVFHFARWEGFLPADGGSIPFLFGAMALAVVPSAVGTFFFRSFLFSEYHKDGHDTLTTALISSLLFALSFLRLETFPIYFLVGIILSVITYVTGSTLVSFFAELPFRMYIVFGESHLLSVLRHPTSTVVCIFALILLLLIFLFLFFANAEHLLYRSGKNGDATPAYRLRRTVDGKNADLAATEQAESGKENGGITFGIQAKKRIEALFSPTLGLCVLLYIVILFIKG